MSDPVPPVPDLAPPRSRGRLSQWSDRVKALLLLSLLAVAGALSGLGMPGAEAERVRDGLSAGGNPRTSLAEVPATVLSAPDREQARPDPTGDGNPPRLALPAAAVSPVTAQELAVAVRRPATNATGPRRAGHAARMPTGPPAGLSV